MVPIGANEIHPQALIIVQNENSTIIKNLLESPFSLSITKFVSSRDRSVEGLLINSFFYNHYSQKDAYFIE
jgi:hypothetical protein